MRSRALFSARQRSPKGWVIPYRVDATAPFNTADDVGAGLPANAVAAATVSDRGKLAGRPGLFAGKPAPTMVRVDTPIKERACPRMRWRLRQ